MGSLEFQYPEAWALLGLLPLVLVLGLWWLRWQRKVINRLADLNLQEGVVANRSRTAGGIRLLLIIVALGLLVVSLANPRQGVGQVEGEREGVDVMFALDLSRSMLAEDLEPSRLERARQFLLRLMNRLEKDRIGLIVFAGNAYLQMPLSTDHDAARLFLKSVHPDDLPTQGTAIGEAIELATRSFEKAESSNGVILVVSDGEDHEAGTEEAIREALDQGATIHCIGIGTSRGGRIPEFIGGRKDYKKDKEGNVVFSRLDESSLRSIAAKGGGQYMTFNGRRDQEREVAEAIAEAERRSFGTVNYSHFVSYYQIPLILALVLLFFERLMTDVRLRLVERLKWLQ